MAKEYFARFRNGDGNLYVNPLRVSIVKQHNEDVSIIMLGNEDADVFVKTTPENVMNELNRALNAMFSELGQQLKDASIYDIQHRR